MTHSLRETFSRLMNGKSNTLRRLMIGLGVAGIGLIAVSEWLPPRAQKPADSAGTASGTVEAAAVEAALEERITALVSQVQGVGSCRVMVTLEQGTRQVYAAEESRSTGEQTSAASEKTLVVDTADGPMGLLITQIQPTVKGVAVVCAGGDDPAVCQRVTDLIATAFNISSRRVCVVKQQ